MGRRAGILAQVEAKINQNYLIPSPSPCKGEGRKTENPPTEVGRFFLLLQKWV